MSKNLKEIQKGLIRAWQNYGDQNALSELIEQYEGLIVTRVNSAMKWNSDKSPHFREDLRSEAISAIIVAATRFDTERDIPFAAYVRNYVWGAVLETAQRAGVPVSFANSHIERKVQRRIFGLVGKHERVGLTSSEALAAAADELGISVDHAAQAVSMRQGKSIEGGGDENGFELEDGAEAADVEIQQDDTLKIIMEVVNEFSIEDQIFIEMRWLSEEPKSLEAIGGVLECSHQWAGKIEKRVMLEFREKLEMRGLSLSDLLKDVA